MKISIVCPLLVNMPTKEDDFLWIKKCVHSIKKNSTEDHEIIVVTNGGGPKEVPIEGIKVIHSEPQGQCHAVNIGVKEATNDYIMVIDEDFIFPTNWEELTEKAKEYDFVSGSLMERGGSFVVNNCGGIMDFDELKFETDALALGKNEWENGFGFPLICKKSVWELVEGYDEIFDPWGSNCDSDLEYKLMLAGIMPRRWKGVLFYHFASVSGTFAPEQHVFWRGNIRQFEQKWNMARARNPEIWSCDFLIDGERLKYKPSWAKLEGNPMLYTPHFELKHIGWATKSWDLFERFWCNLMGFKQTWELHLTPEMMEKIFGVKEAALCRRYEKDGMVIEMHHFDNQTDDPLPFNRRGLNHICIQVDDRDKFLKLMAFDKRVYDNPKGYQNIFIKDFEGNWIELWKKM